MARSVPKLCAHVADSLLTPNEGDRRGQRQRVNHDRTEHDDDADRQWTQGRDSVWVGSAGAMRLFSAYPVILRRKPESPSTGYPRRRQPSSPPPRTWTRLSVPAAAKSPAARTLVASWGSVQLRTISRSRGSWCASRSSGLISWAPGMRTGADVRSSAVRRSITTTGARVSRRCLRSSALSRGSAS